MTIAIYPGSFDPITNGHLDIITRAARVFDKVIVGVYDTPAKHLLFTTSERVDLIKQSIVNLPNVEVESFTGLTVNFAKKIGAKVMVRGLRMSGDFEREFNMAMLNKSLLPELELVCFMASVENQFLSSTLLKEAANLGGNINGLVPKHVTEALREVSERRQTDYSEEESLMP